MNPPLLGLHHVTAITSNARANLAFYTGILGLRLVKKTVNQDDVTAYHLFYGDGLGRPGTELTFFDWPHADANRPGGGTVVETALRVAGGGESLSWWARWFEKKGVSHGKIETWTAGQGVSLRFTDPEDQNLRLVAGDNERAEHVPWRGTPAPAGAQITGLDAVTLCVGRPELTAQLLQDALGFRPAGEALFETGAGGPGTRVYLTGASERGYPGSGGVHHVAFRVPDATAQIAWRERIVAAGVAVSQVIDRYYFRSIYFREPNGILFEIATDGPGFATDEDAAHLGENLALPPFLEPRRSQITAGLRPLD